MKFKNIKFKKNNWGNWVSSTELPSGTTLSVVAGAGLYCTPKMNLDTYKKYTTFEVALLKDGEFIESEVRGWQDKEEIDAIIKEFS